MESKIKNVAIKISGVNLSKIYKECEKQNITLYHVNRVDYKNIEFKVDISQKQKIFDIAKSQNYRYEELQNFGINKVKLLAKNHIGIVVGILFFAVLLIFFSQFLWSIKIYGNEKISNEQIYAILKSNSVKVGSFSGSIDIEKLESEILNSLDDISLCSIIKKGTTLVINIKEKIHSADLDNFLSEENIVANCNMQITDLVVSQGTALKKIGDSVKTGDIIVAGYFFDTNGQKVFCRANANIKATTWYSDTIIYEKEKQIAVKTGNKSTEGYMLLFGQKFETKKANNNFENFETEQKESYLFGNNILPVKYVWITYYEVYFEKVVQNFEIDKENIIVECEKNAMQKVVQNQIVSKVFSVVDEQSDCFIVTSYAQVDIEF